MLEKVLEEFKKYVNNYDMTREKINLKYYHSLEVAKLSKELAVKLGMSQNDIDLATEIGILHDIGRFEQAARYDSFSDKNMDHAEYGVKILFEDGLIKNFINDESIYDVIEKAIDNHNKLYIDKGLKEKELLFAKIIRDTDKIDIFRIRNESPNNIISENFSPKVLEDFYKCRSINKEDIKNKSDSLLCVMAFIFDMNFSESLDILKERRYYQDFLDNIKVSIEQKEEFMKVKTYALNYLNGGKKNVREKVQSY